MRMKNVLLAIIVLGTINAGFASTSIAAIGTIITSNNLTGPTSGPIFVSYVNLEDPTANYAFLIEKDDPKTQPVTTELPDQSFLVLALDPFSGKTVSRRIPVTPNNTMYVYVYIEGSALCIRIADEKAFELRDQSASGKTR